jgi:hypothetical protein
MIWRVSGSPFAAFRRLSSCSSASNAALSFSRSGDVAIAFSSASRNGVSFFFSVMRLLDHEGCSGRVRIFFCVSPPLQSKSTGAGILWDIRRYDLGWECLAACLDALSS